MSSWEKLEDQDNLLSDSASGTSCIQNFCSGKRRRFNIIALSVLAITLVLVLVLFTTLNQGAVTKLSQTTNTAPLETTTQFIERFPEDSNETELTWKKFDPPEFSPILPFVEEILSLFTPTNDTTSSNSVHEPQQVPVTILYEVLSVTSRDFLVHQFFPTFAKLAPYLNPVLVPYGNANMSKSGSVSCEHGFDECQGNLVHACAIKESRFNDSGSTGRLMAYLGCMLSDMEIQNPRADAIGKECAKYVKISWDPIYNCTQNGEGMAMIASLKEITDNIPILTRPLKLPIVLVNKNIVDVNGSNKNFLRYLCTHELANEPDATACKTT